MLVKLVLGSHHPGLEHGILTMLGSGVQELEVRSGGIPVFSLDLQRWGGRLSLFTSLSRAVHRFQPDLLQGWMYHGNALAMLARQIASGADKPLVAFNIRHSIGRMREEKVSTRAFIHGGSRLTRWVETIIYNSEVAADQHESIGYPSAKRLVIPNGFDLNLFAPRAWDRERIRNELRIGEDEFVFGMIQRWHPMKGHALLLDSFSRLRGDARLLLAGRGVDASNPALRRTLETFGLSDESVRLLGERPDVAALCNAVDAIVVSSLYGEGFPNIVGEAMACGTPCLVTDVGECRRIVGDTGEVVRPGSVTALTEGLNKFLGKGVRERETVSRSCRQRIAEKYALTSVVDSYDELFARLLGVGGS